MGDFQSRERPVYRLEAHFRARRGFEHARFLGRTNARLGQSSAVAGRPLMGVRSAQEDHA